MKRLLLSGLVCSVMLVSVVSAWAAPALGVPAPDFDFGTVFQGENVRHTFVFTNRGDAPLTVEKISSSCGCTAALASAKVLAPGESGELQASFDSTRFRGDVSKTIYLYTNDPAQPMLQLHLKGQVREELAMEPKVVNFGTLAPRRTVRSTVTLINQGSRKVQLRGLETTTPELAARLSGEVVPPGGRVTVELTLTPKPGYPRFSGYVLFKADGVITHDLRIPVYADLGERSAGLQ